MIGGGKIIGRTKEWKDGGGGMGRMIRGAE